MSEFDLSMRFIDEQIVEWAPQQAARRYALELGLPTISRALGAHLAFVAASTQSRKIIEIGSTGGLTTTWLHRGSPGATITCIDGEPEHLAQTRRALLDTGHAASAIRCITGDPHRVLPRMSEDTYDLVLIAGPLQHVSAHLQHGLRVVRPGGTILVLNALHQGRVADPARRDSITASLRLIIREFQRQPDLACSVIPVDGGLLQVTSLAP